MDIIIRINGHKFKKCSNQVEACGMAAMLYESCSEIILTGSTGYKAWEKSIRRIMRKHEGIEITLNDKNWENFIPKDEWIENRLKIVRKY